MRITSLNKLTRNVIFHDAVVNKYGNKSIKIEVKTPEGLLGELEGPASREPLVIESPLLFSFGVQDSVNEDGNLNGYSMAMCLWRDAFSEKQLEFYEGLKDLEELCRNHLEKEWGIEISKNFKIPLVERDDDRPPVLYPKLIFSKKTEKIYTLFHSRESDKLKPLDYLNQYCKVKMSLIIESIYIGDNGVSLQIKANDVFVKPLKTRVKLVSPPSDDEDEE